MVCQNIFQFCVHVPQAVPPNENKFWKTQTAVKMSQRLVQEILNIGDIGQEYKFY